MTIQEHIARLETAIKALRQIEARGVERALSVASQAYGAPQVHLMADQFEKLDQPGAVMDGHWSVIVEGVEVFRLATAREKLEAIVAAESAP